MIDELPDYTEYDRKLKQILIQLEKRVSMLEPVKTAMPQLAVELTGEVKAEDLARAFHEAYEALAPGFNYKTRKATTVKWEDVPTQNMRLMIATAQTVLNQFRVEVKK